VLCTQGEGKEGRREGGREGGLGGTSEGLKPRFKMMHFDCVQ